MAKLFSYFIFSLLFISQLEAQWAAPRRARFCWRNCYMDPTYSNYDGIMYGYVDNINYPDRYDLPVNRCFRYKPPLRCNPSDQYYLQNCIKYTLQKNQQNR